MQCELDLQVTIAQAEATVARAEERVRVSSGTAAAVLTRESAAANANVASLEAVVPANPQHAQLIGQAKEVPNADTEIWLLSNRFLFIRTNECGAVW